MLLLLARGNPPLLPQGEHVLPDGFGRMSELKDSRAGTRGHGTSLGVKATASLLQGPRWFCPRNGAKPTGRDPDPPSLFPGGQHHFREDWASLPGRVRVSAAARAAHSTVPAQGLPRGGGRPWLGTTAPWWTGRGWHHPAAHPQAGRGRPRLGSGGQGPCTCLPGEGPVCTRPPAPYRVPAADDAQPAVLGGGGRGHLWDQNREAGRGRPLPGAPAPPAQPREALSWGLRRPRPSRRL